METQLALDLITRTWGGIRPGAGRKTNKSKGLASHDSRHATRPRHVARNPQHITLRCIKAVSNLRCPEVYACVERALRKISSRLDFRVVHVSIQRNHLHFIIEATNNAALESGMRALAISLAKRINRVLDRTGKVFEFRYHALALTSPRQTRNALAYVLNNWRRHNEDERNGIAERFHDPRQLLERDPLHRLGRLATRPLARRLRRVARHDASDLAAVEGLGESEPPDSNIRNAGLDRLTPDADA